MERKSTKHLHENSKSPRVIEEFTKLQQERLSKKIEVNKVVKEQKLAQLAGANEAPPAIVEKASERKSNSSKKNLAIDKAPSVSARIMTKGSELTQLEKFQ